ncbi:MAG: ERF family protein [Anaerolineae bacterium]|nr:ERF family protein [Anaerolineae bacterium]
MNASDQINELAAALAKAQAELRNPAFDSQNPHFKSRFASLAGVRDAITPVLSKHGLSVTQLTTNDDQGRASVETILLHSSGQWIGSTLTVPPPKADAHGTGSAITYARRYALMAIVNVVGDEDDDGNRAAQSKQTEDADAEAIESARTALLKAADADKLTTVWNKVAKHFKANPSAVQELAVLKDQRLAELEPA